MRRKNFSITQTCNFSFLKNTHASLDSRDTQLRYTESRVTSRLGGTPGRLGNRLPRIATRRVGATRRTCANLSLSLSLFPPPLPSPFVRIVWKWIQDGHFERARAARTHSRACVRACVCRWWCGAACNESVDIFCNQVRALLAKCASALPVCILP